MKNKTQFQAILSEQPEVSKVSLKVVALLTVAYAVKFIMDGWEFTRDCLARLVGLYCKAIDTIYDRVQRI